MVGTVKKSTETIHLTMFAILLIPSSLLSSGELHEPCQYHAPSSRITMRTLPVEISGDRGAMHTCVTRRRGAVAYVEGGACRLVSRNRNAFKTNRWRRPLALIVRNPLDKV
jgi:hypothetical protein